MNYIDSGVSPHGKTKAAQHRFIFYIIAAVAVLAAAALIWYAANVLLVAFAGILLAIFWTV